MANKNASLINKKLHAICEDHTTYSVPLGLTKKEETTIPIVENITITFEYAPEKTFKMEFKPDDMKKMTCGELFTDSLTRLLAIVEKNPDQKEVHVESIVSMQTKKKDLIKDFYLTLDDKKIDFLEDGTILKYFHKTFVLDIEESPIESRISLKDFEILAKLGAGGFATVYLVRWKKNGKFYALKQMDKGSLTMEDKKALLRERNAMFDLKFPYLVRLHTAFQTDKCCYLVLDFLAGGDLLHALSKFKRFSENTCKHIVAEILVGLKQIHERKYIYRDLKIENVLLDIDGHAHICDFGLTKRVEKIQDLNYSLCGTPEFLAPEVYLETGYNYLVDIYAVAPLLYELVTGTLPFETENLSALKMKIIKAKPVIPSYLTPELQNLLERLFEKDPAKRIGAKGGVKEVMLHPWFKGIDWFAVEAKKVKMPFVLNLDKRKFKTVPIDFNIEDSKNVKVLDLLSVDEENKGEKEKTRVACFSYYSPLQKAKLNQRKESEVRSAKRNLQRRGEEGGEDGSKKKPKKGDSTGWIGEFDQVEIDEAQEGTLLSKQKMSPYILNAKLKLMNQVKLENTSLGFSLTLSNPSEVSKEKMF
eukprot:CAMPEP_0176422360 /NCGR_PEP_ID=MMETSP0127-20121128/9689_1 /TAXON_ID=938130 /ORGANISM="Platyophrya macrostoma, Strain WH" /LENGTH=588 /DNA_ID=CAMNT_0017803199 /DNA_START=28 /DNA_END=1794 /DNA_ORIENTATION=+